MLFAMASISAVMLSPLLAKKEIKQPAAVPSLLLRLPQQPVQL